LRRRIEKRTNSVSRQFDRVCEVLLALEYLAPSDADGALAVTARGQHLMRLYSELDLLAAEAIRRGVWDGLSPSELAAALSVLVFEARRPDDSVEPRMPSPAVATAIKETTRLWRDLDVLEREHSLDFLRPPDPGFAWAAQRWAEGDDLDDVLTGIDLAAGDFVRNMKQLIDLTGQVADASGDSELRRTARATIESLRHGVVAYSNLS
jgi:ATP-dependent RNA helicase HelY